MLQRILTFLGSLRLTVVGLLLLLVLTVWGTLYQVDHGLYLAQERFYQSWFLRLGDVLPFPGAQLVMVVLFINLLASVLLQIVRGRLRVGFLATHAGLLLMLAAGGVTFYFGKEAQLSLVEGQGSNVALSFRDWELALLPGSAGMDRKVSALNARALRPGRVIAMPGGAGAIRVEDFHRNAGAVRDVHADQPRTPSGFTDLEPRPPGRDPATDLPGLVVTLLRDGQESGRYLLWGGDPAPVALPADPLGRSLVLRRQRMPLPAVLELLDFRRELHPGSGVAKSYSSLMRVGEEDSGRKVLISMNKPLRLQGYTFYQSSFSSGPGGREVSTLSVVHNYGRTMPYLATGMTAAGMLLHFTGMLVSRLRQRQPGRGSV